MNRHDNATTADDEATPDGVAELRIDRWLWYARFYKSRSLAAAAVSAGRVRVDGGRSKPSRSIRVGARLRVAVNGRDVELCVCALPVRRGPAPEARRCYEETPASQARGVEWQAQQRLAALALPRRERRPDKKERRELMDLARRQGRS